MAWLPSAVSHMNQYDVCLDRIIAYLGSPEVADRTIGETQKNNVVELQKVSFSWTGGEVRFFVYLIRLFPCHFDLLILFV